MAWPASPLLRSLVWALNFVALWYLWAYYAHLHTLQRVIDTRHSKSTVLKSVLGAVIGQPWL